MGEWPEFYAFGVPLLLFGIGLLRWQRKADRLEPPTDEREARFLRNRSRRRTQVAILIGVVGGLMIACGAVDPKVYPKVWVGMVVLILLLALWIAILAAGDLFATRTMLGQEVSHLELQRRVIEDELRRTRQK